ncbi:MAG: Hpt domain-containing protein, partial [Pseudomonadales bacterium]
SIHLLIKDTSKSQASSEYLGVHQILEAIDVLVIAASAAQLTLSAKFALQNSIAWLEHYSMAQTVGEKNALNAEQVLRELLFSIALFDSDIDKVKHFKSQYRLLEALNINHPEDVLHLGTTDIETKELVYESVLSDLMLLKNALECYLTSTYSDQLRKSFSKSDNQQEGMSFESLAIMASTIRYTLAITHCKNLSDQFGDMLSDIEAQLLALHSNNTLSNDEDKKTSVIKNVSESVCSVEALLRQSHLGAVSHNDAGHDDINQSVSEVSSTEQFLEADFDDDIVDIFLEEANEVLVSLNENIIHWVENASSDARDDSYMHEIRRGFHTLKGSGRMAGAEHIGDAAWSIELLINRIVDGSLPMRDSHIAIVAEAIEFMPNLIQAFSQRVLPQSEPLQSLIERASLLAEDSDSITVEESIYSNEEDNVVDISRRAVKPDEVDKKDKDRQEKDKHEEETPELTAVDADDHKENTENESTDLTTGEIDRETLETIFISELEVQLSVVNGYLESHAMDSDIYPSEAVERALHTIVGGARIAGNQWIAEIFAPAEILLCLIRKRCSISDNENNLLIKIHDWALEKITTGTLNHSSDVDEEAAKVLIDALNQAVADDLSMANEEQSLLVDSDLIFKAEDFLRHWRSVGSPPAEYASMLSVLEKLEQAAEQGEQVFVQQQCHCLNQLYQHFSQSGLHYQAYTTLLQGHRDLEDMLDRIAAGQEVAASSIDILEALLDDEKKAQQTIQQADLQLNDEAQINSKDCLDHEIVSIFLDESEDLIESVEVDVQQWLNNRSDSVYLKKLMRPLHTIKGGARMAGLEIVGDISHEFETLLLSVGNGDKKMDGRFFKKVGQFLNQLIDAISATRCQLHGATEVDQEKPDNLRVKDEDKRSDEMIRVPSILLEQLVNLAGETSISRSLIEEQINDFSQSTDEVGSTIQRLKEQLRRLEIEMEAQIEFRKEQVESEGNEEFDPLEMDRYSQVQQLSKSLVESASDLKDLKNTLVEKTRDIETSLIQQARINTRLQEGLMQTRTVPLSRHIVPRLRRIVRQVSGELDKPITFKVSNAGGELDRSMLERMVTPLEHVLRNAIDHGIEPGAERKKLGKPAQGVISLNIRREGGDVVLELSDDGRGLDITAIRKKAIARGLVNEDTNLSDEEVMRFIFAPGFSTAKELTQLSGRGVGMDVVQSEIADLGGSVELHSKQKQGTMFVFRVPFTVSMNRALLVSTGGETLAVPLDSIEGIVRVSPYEIEQYYGDDADDFFYAGQKYDFNYLGHLINGSSYHSNSDMVAALPVLLVRGADKFYALQVDRLIGSREIVVKSLGAQFANVEGIAGATVLGDGSVVMIADLVALVRAESNSVSSNNIVSIEKTRDHLVAMVVDDSVTVRKV